MQSPVPVWVWVDYPRVPRYIGLNLQLIHKYAPPPHFQVHLVNLSSVRRYLPDLPSEFWRLSHRAAPSDAARMALMARHGGLYLDADFLVARPLLPIVEALQQHEMVVYSTRQDRWAIKHCEKTGDGASTNFFAARPNTSALVDAWTALVDHLRRPCNPLIRRGKRYVCCPPGVGPCRTPWALTDAYLGPSIIRAISRPVGRMRLRCLPSFTPGLGAPCGCRAGTTPKCKCLVKAAGTMAQSRTNAWGKAVAQFLLPRRALGCSTLPVPPPRGRLLSSEPANQTFDVCCERRGASSLKCTAPGLLPGLHREYGSDMTDFFQLHAYHLFESINGAEFARYHRIESSNLLVGHIYRAALAPRSDERRDALLQYMGLGVSSSESSSDKVATGSIPGTIQMLSAKRNTTTTKRKARAAAAARGSTAADAAPGEPLCRLRLYVHDGHSPGHVLEQVTASKHAHFGVARAGALPAVPAASASDLALASGSATKCSCLLQPCQEAEFGEVIRSYTAEIPLCRCMG
jgi:hypothetical protein